jgi:hypothetical protein
VALERDAVVPMLFHGATDNGKKERTQLTAIPVIHRFQKGIR